MPGVAVVAVTWGWNAWLWLGFLRLSWQGGQHTVYFHLEDEIVVVDLSFHLHRLTGDGRQSIPAWSRKDICQAVRLNIIWDTTGFR